MLCLWEKNKMLPLFATAGMISLMMTGCSGELPESSDVEITAVENGVYFSDEQDCADAEDIAAIYRDIYEEAAETNELGSLETLRRILVRLGENGYSAVDSENQIDMVCPEQLKQFCRQVEEQEEAEETLIVIISANSFVKYEFTTKDGTVEVQSSHCLHKRDSWETVSTNKYPAYTWVYSKEGYLFFEEYHMDGFDGPSGHTAVRIEPLNEMCRELNRKYLMTIGYKLNNLFTSEWSEDDFKELNFYDLYEVLYQMKKDEYPALDFHEGENYEIPKAEFESVFQTFFQIDGQALQQYTTYHEDTETYRYRTRGMYDFAPTPYVPYPEVISYEENKDGTIKLLVNAVWTDYNSDYAFTNRIVVQPFDDGTFRYLSNFIEQKELEVPEIEIEILMDFETEEIITLGELTPKWWI